MMQVSYAEIAIVCDHEDGPIQLDSKQLSVLCHVNRVVEEN